MQFKTFYVMVQSSEARKDWSRVIFQNILCYGLIGAWSRIAVSGVPFQNILCYGSMAVLLTFAKLNILFQNILCYGSIKNLY